MALAARSLTLPLLLPFLLSSGPALGGYVLTDQGGETTWVSKGKVRTDDSEDRSSFVVDLSSGKMTTIRHTHRTYATGTPEEVCAVFQASLAQMAKAMPPEARAAAEKLMGERRAEAAKKTVAVTVSSAGRGEPIAGFPTEKYTVAVDGKPYEEIWLTMDTGLLGELSDPARWVELERKMMRCLPKELTDIGASQDPETDPEYQKLMLKGFRLKVVRFDTSGDDPVTDTLIVKAESRTIPDAEFRAPQGYREVSLEEALQFEVYDAEPGDGADEGQDEGQGEDD